LLTHTRNQKTDGKVEVRKPPKSPSGGLLKGLYWNICNKDKILNYYKLTQKSPEGGFRGLNLFFMNHIKLSIDKAFGFISEQAVAGYKSKVAEANAALHNGTGKGNDFLGWLNLPSSISKNEIDMIIFATLSPDHELLIQMFRSILLDQYLHQ
jgi:glucose-6-phosphate isomerase